MHIRNLGVISEATLELAERFTVVTGETGAGKTMVVTALSLLLGGRADSGVVRARAPSAVVEGRFRVPAAGFASSRAAEAGADVEPLDDDVGVRPHGGAPPCGLAELLVARTVSAGGRSRAHLGGRSVPVGVLGELADHLVAVHGQSEQLLLRSSSRQREVLDTFAGDGLAALLEQYREAYERRAEVRAQLSEITTRARERAQEADLLRIGLEELEQVDPQPGEDEALRAEEERLANAEDLRSAAGEAHAVFAADDLVGESTVDAAGLVDSARRRLEAVAAHDDRLAGLAGRLAELGYGLADVAVELAGYVAGLDADPVRLEQVQQRRADLGRLTRKYGEDVAEVLAWGERAAKRLADLTGDDDRVDALRSELASLDTTLTGLGDVLHERRTAAATELSEAVTVELAELAMPHARLVVDVRDTGDLGPAGRDRVELQLVAHAGADARPLARSASGGELSRVMLALEVVLAGSDPVPTFVFDEVDAGVGGRAATEIGRRLAVLSRRAQVVAVTHLPQVAAFADRHLVVVKSDDGEVTRSGVQRLDDGERVRELARMLAGQEESASARAHAEELLANARGAGVR
ncbi:MAG: DNA repair protein RecN [Actinomycetes bacterium]